MPGLTKVLSVVAAVIVFVGGSGGDHGVGDGVGGAMRSLRVF